MIISDKTSTLSFKKIFRWIAALLIIAGLFYLFSPFKNIGKRVIYPDAFYCDAEVVKDRHFISQGFEFMAGKSQSDLYARSGKHSCFLPKNDKENYGLGFELPNFKPGETYNVSVWRFREKGGRDGHLVVSGNGTGKFYKATNKIVRHKDGWDYLEVNFVVPKEPLNKISIYVFNKGTYPVYFDDLLIQKTKAAPVVDSLAWRPEVIQLSIKDKGMEKLRQKRFHAFRNGILESAEDDWVKVKINTPETEKPVRASIRLKGDWLDHLGANKWSFRVKTKGGEAFNRLRTFSLHTPKARGYLNEWVLHKLFEKEDILSTYYDFAMVELNDEGLGVYAIEEHFDKVLLERQKRREGPIVRFSENGFWEGMKRHAFLIDAIDHDVTLNVKTPQAAPVTPFQKNKTISNPALKEQFEQATMLLEQYKFGARKMEDIFDLERMAKYFAICDALSAHHGIAWHNQRFYFNPLSGKLEPIGFDGFGEKVYRKNYLSGAGALNRRQIDKLGIENLFFLDVDFTTAYSKYIQQFTSEEYLNAFFVEIELELKEREELLQTEFEDYKFEVDRLLTNAGRMHSMVLPHNEFSLKANVQQILEDGKILKIANLHNLPIHVIGSGRKKNVIQDSLKSPVLLEAFYPRAILEKRLKNDTSSIKASIQNSKEAFIEQEPLSYQEILVPAKAKYLFYTPLGIDSVFYTSIDHWKINPGSTSPQKTFENIELESNEVFDVSERNIYFKPGEHSIQKDIIIPEGYQVIFAPGCRMDFVNRSKFISKSPVFMNGNEDEPIIIRSSDKSANGFSVLQTSEQSKLHYVEFDGFDTMKDKGWNFTGAITFFEADVLVDHSVFNNNVCEDALNIIRSEFTFQKSLISNTFSDGLDADFCKGSVINSNFFNTGNDGMDFSGSVMMIENTTVQKAGDKAVSVGEDSDASIMSINIEDSNIGVAAKDLSTLVIQKMKMTRCNIGFAAYQKKPEYGGANIIVNNYEATDIRRLHSIQENCTLQLQEKIIQGEVLNFQK